jgi:hypothetical protein
MNRQESEATLPPRQEEILKRAHGLGEQAVADFLATGKMAEEGLDAICDIVGSWKKKVLIHEIVETIMERDGSDRHDQHENPVLDLLAAGAERLAEASDEFRQSLCSQREEVQARIEQTVCLAKDLSCEKFITPSLALVRRTFSGQEQ